MARGKEHLDFLLFYDWVISGKKKKLNKHSFVQKGGKEGIAAYGFHHSLQIILLLYYFIILKDVNTCY